MLRRELDRYLRHLSIERGLSAHTTAAYRRDLLGYIDWVEQRGADQAESIDRALVTEFVRWRGDAPGARSSRARQLSSLRGFHRWLAEEGVLANDPSERIAPPVLPRRLPHALSIDEVERLLASPSPDEPLGLRDRALLEFLYATGARVSEVTALDVDDVVEPDIVRVRGKGGKDRILPVGRFAREALDRYLVRVRPTLARSGTGGPALFLGARGGRLTRQSVWLIIRAAAERAEITSDVSPHALRHSYATHLLQGGADVRVVQELLGHASVTTTQIYTQVTADALREMYGTAHPRAR